MVDPRRASLPFCLLLSLVLFAVRGHAAPAAAAPACAGPEHRQFDFWIGEWDVVTPEGKPAGVSSVTRELDGCVIHEHWQGAGAGAGFDGQSFNLYEESSKTWRQSWVDNTGQRLALLQGSFADGKMTLQGEKDTPKGHRWVRVTWSVLGPNEVRQTVEASVDAGKSWNLGFDGRYRRKTS